MMIYQKPIRNLLFGALVLFAGLCTVVLAANAQMFSVEVVKVKTVRGVFFFNTELAVSPEQRQQGLMFRRSMDRDAAMLFRWQVEQPVSMWMKNTYIPLDMVFIRRDGLVANIARATTPHSLIPVSSKGNVIAVMELIAGTVDRIGLAAGDKISHAMFK